MALTDEVQGLRGELGDLRDKVGVHDTAIALLEQELTMTTNKVNKVASAAGETSVKVGETEAASVSRLMVWSVIGGLIILLSAVVSAAASVAVLIR